MSQVSVTMTTPLVTPVCSGTLTMTVIMPLPVRLTAASDEHAGLLLPHLIPMDTIRGVVGLTTVLQSNPSASAAISGLWQYAMGPPLEVDMLASTCTNQCL